MVRFAKWASGYSFLFLAIYGAGTFGCQYFPLLAQSCGNSSLFSVLALGLMYMAVLLSIVILPVWILMYLRVTVIMGLSKIFYGDYRTLEFKFSEWLSSGK